jgi:hypothetical protein
MDDRDVVEMTQSTRRAKLRSHDIFRTPLDPRRIDQGRSMFQIMRQMMRPRYAYTPKLLYFIFLFIIDSFRTPSDIIPRLFAPFPTSKQRSRRFAPSLRPSRTFALRRISFRFFGNTPPFIFLRRLSASPPLFVPLFACTSALAPATHRTYLPQ